MKDCRQFYIDGKWISPVGVNDFSVTNPAIEDALRRSRRPAPDVDKAVVAAKKAFETYSETTIEERLALLRRVIEVYQSRRSMASHFQRDGRASIAVAVGASSGWIGSS
jgi:aldehyde dehydrogenase (NAD+)